MATRRIAYAAAVMMLLGVPAAQAFDFSAYQTTDLDAIVDQPLPAAGADIFPRTPLKLSVTLVGYGEPCQTGFLKKAMLMAGIPQTTIDAVAITRCIKVRTAKGREVRLFIQDPVAEFLPKEIPLGNAATFYVVRLYGDATGPGLLVNEFSADVDRKAGKQPLPPSREVVARAPEPRKTGSNANAELRGEWLRNGAGFVCRVPVQGKPPPEAINPDTMSQACLHMGPFSIGAEAKTVVSLLGQPHRTLPQPNDATALVYFLEQPGRLPYLVATVQKDKILTLQVSGTATAKDYTFNHVKLGDDTTTLANYFGQAMQIKPSGLADTDLWNYSPWPFSFEVKDGRVTSVRIVDPTYRD